jgi:PAS domain S-box-containing protein
MSGWSRDWLCRQIVDRSGAAILFADSEGVIRLWNRGAEAMFGYDASAALGQQLDIIIPERWRERHAAGYRQAMATGSTRKDGTKLSIEFTITLVRDGMDTVLGAAAVIHDVTERWEREKRARDRLLQLEAGGRRV